MDNPYRLVLVVWQDSGNPHIGWKWVSSIENPPKHICQTVGWLVKDGKIVTIAQSIVLGEDGNHQVNGVMQIPRRFINSIDDVFPISGVIRETAKREREQGGELGADIMDAVADAMEEKPADKLTIIGKLNDETKPWYDQPVSPREVRKPYPVRFGDFQIMIYPEEDTDIGWEINNGREYRLIYNGQNRLVDIQETGRYAVYHGPHEFIIGSPYMGANGRMYQDYHGEDNMKRAKPYGWHPPEE